MANKDLKVAIAVVGVANTGKTTTIDSVRTSLKSDGWEEICRIVFKAPKAKHIDEKSILKKGDIKIAICPRGDSKKEVEENFKYAQEQKVDIILYARRTKGEVVPFVNGLQEEHGFKDYEVCKTSISSNDAKVEEIKALILSSIKDIQ